MVYNAVYDRVSCVQCYKTASPTVFPPLHYGQLSSVDQLSGYVVFGPNYASLSPTYEKSFCICTCPFGIIGFRPIYIAAVSG